MVKNEVLIGISGRKGAGKDTVGAIFRRFGVKTIAFADPLYQGVSTIFGISIDELKDRFLKEIPHPKLFGKSPRYALQTLGTEWGRELIHNDMWVELALREADTWPYIAITDVRFDNEAVAIRHRGGSIIHVTRPGDYDVNDNHPSERGVMGVVGDYYINNNGTLKQLEEKTVCLIQQKFACLTTFSYRTLSDATVYTSKASGTDGLTQPVAS